MREVWTVLRELTTNWEEEINSYGHAHRDGIRRIRKILIKSHGVLGGTKDSFKEQHLFWATSSTKAQGRCLSLFRRL